MVIEEQLGKINKPSIVVLFVTDTRNISPTIAGAVQDAKVMVVEEHVMKKLSGLDTVGPVTAVAEIQVQPQV